MCTRHPNLVSSAFYAIPIFHIVIITIISFSIQVIHEKTGVRTKYFSIAGLLKHNNSQINILYNYLTNNIQLYYERAEHYNKEKRQRDHLWIISHSTVVLCTSKLKILQIIDHNILLQGGGES